ncbi:MAG: hypothetical protein M3R61_02185 [Chloroflexota bacterium]|nr:hypothetical protein [Chloroflexota bacterium]
MLRPAPDFRHKLASVGLGVDDIAQQAAISRAAIFAWLNPGTQPSRTGIRLKNAWAVARAYAAAAGIDKEVAFTALFVDQGGESAPGEPMTGL